ncbi:hypothetical protein [Oscillatoria sp. FACHB-1406]|uniref:hypothetical protein n=1 Tax=Oscillatoria sp. FACHB-1406 TaxID=2692846 RepID=UPI001689E721|nr:hypothetical protein [Oscillatoria sp. FACHB-1406]MBD2576920.1 hypothetical protein [Oscillatoria sp. FACHB-1406]
MSLKTCRPNWSGFWLAIALSSSLIAGCTTSPPAGQNDPNPTATASPAPETPQTDATSTPVTPPVNGKWTAIVPGQEVEGLNFGKEGNLKVGDKVLLDKIMVSGSSDGSITYAKSLTISPSSPSGNFTFFRACESLPGEPGLCWALYLVDRARGQVFRPPAAKYAVEDWVQWSPDGRYALLTSTLEGAYWLHAIDLQAGEKTVNIELDQRRPQLDSFAWQQGSKFKIAVGESQKETFALDLPTLFEKNPNGCTLGTALQARNCPVLPASAP